MTLDEEINAIAAEVFPGYDWHQEPNRTKVKRAIIKAFATVRAEEVESCPYSYSSMKDAPRDGTPILGWVPTYYQGEGAWVVVLWMGQKGMRDAGWMDNRAWLVTPTHWTPLPPSPDATNGCTE